MLSFCFFKCFVKYSPNSSTNRVPSCNCHQWLHHCPTLSLSDSYYLRPLYPCLDNGAGVVVNQVRVMGYVATWMYVDGRTVVTIDTESGMHNVD